MGENIDKVKGRAKQAAGDLTDNDELRNEGRTDETAGKAKSVVNDIKDKADDAVDAVKDRVDKTDDRRRPPRSGRATMALPPPSVRTRRVGGGGCLDGWRSSTCPSRPTPWPRGTPVRAVEARFATHPRAADLLLCVSEVVTNAVRHAGPPHSLRLSQAGDTLRVEVADAEQQAPILNQQDPLSTSGRGLRILDQLATRWGSEPTEDGKAVWFEFEL